MLCGPPSPVHSQRTVVSVEIFSAGGPNANFPPFPSTPAVTVAVSVSVRSTMVPSKFSPLRAIHQRVVQELYGTHLHPLSSYLTVWPLLFGMALAAGLLEVLIRYTTQRGFGRGGFRLLVDVLLVAVHSQSHELSSSVGLVTGGSNASPPSAWYVSPYRWPPRGRTGARRRSALASSAVVKRLGRRFRRRGWGRRFRRGFRPVPVSAAGSVLLPEDTHPAVVASAATPVAVRNCLRVEGRCIAS